MVTKRRKWPNKKGCLSKQLGFKSDFEMCINQQLVDADIKFSYEGPLNLIRYIQPATNKRYTADFLLENGILIETKGLFTVENRKKHLYIQKQWPILDIRFVFQRASNKINKRSKTTYASWCERYGFKYATKWIPKEWLAEVKPRKELNAIIETLKGFK